MYYRKIPKYSDTRNWTRRLYHTVMRPKDADRIENSVDPDQTAPLRADLGLHCLAQIYLSKNLGSLQYGLTVLPKFV